MCTFSSLFNIGLDIEFISRALGHTVLLGVFEAGGDTFIFVSLISDIRGKFLVAIQFLE